MDQEERSKILAKLWEQSGRTNPTSLGAVLNHKKGGKRSFEEWRRLVDAELLKKCGMDSDTLPDWNYFEAYESGVTPAAAARRAIRSANEY